VDRCANSSAVSATASAAETTPTSAAQPAVPATPTAAAAITAGGGGMVEQQINYGFHLCWFGDSGFVHLRNFLESSIFSGEGSAPGD
jgi:hypothetical protein